MSAEVVTPIDIERTDLSLIERLASSVSCARKVEFYRSSLPQLQIERLEDFAALPLSSRVDLSMATDLRELIVDPRRILRSVYPFYQNAGTFPFQVVNGERDLFARHERMCELFEATGFRSGGETLVLTTPPHFFFASDFCAEILFEEHHACLQNVVHLDPGAIRERIEDFGAELLVLATTDPKLTPEIIPDCVRTIVTFRGGYPEMAELDQEVVDIYTLTEIPYLGFRKKNEPHYSYDPEQFYVERSPAGLLTVTTLFWDLMPFIRYQTYDLCDAVDAEAGTFELTSFGEW